MKTYKVTALGIRVWNADDYLNDRNTNPLYTDCYLFQDSERAREFAAAIDYDSDIYNDGWICEDYELDEDTILEYCDSLEDFETYLDYEDNHRQLDELAASILFDEGKPIDCANYDFDKSIEGAVVVEWSWQTYVGYCRKFEGLRYAYSNETESVLTKRDETFNTQISVVLTAEDVANSEDLQADLEDALMCGWKWRNPSEVRRAIESF